MLKSKLLGAAVAGLAGISIIAGPASAASWNYVSGTVYSPCSGKVWYQSTNGHTKVGTGSVQLQFSNLNPGGVSWKLLGQSGQQIGSQQNWGGTETGITRTLASSVTNGTTFYNMFKEYDGKCGYANYNFTGSEYF